MRRTTVVSFITVLVVLITAGGEAVARSARVVGGVPTTTAEWPWIVSLQARRDAQNVWLCGGVVIAPRLVLTAAHCVIDAGLIVKPSRVIGRVGSTDLNAQDGLVFRGYRIAVHPQYDRVGLEGGPFDAAVIETTVDLPAAVALATAQDVRYADPGVVAQIAGWGFTSAAGAETSVLMQADVPIVSDETCAADNQIPLAEARLMVCAGRPEGGVDSCQGDSGGPLRVPAGRETPDPADDRWLIAGVVSWGYECGAPRRPGLYSRVSTYQAWVARLIAREPAAWALASDAAPPRVRLRAATQQSGSVARLRYRVQGEIGKTRESISIRRTRGGTVLRRVAVRFSAKRATADTTAKWAVPVDFVPGPYVWCLTSQDQAGNRSELSCAALTIT